MKNITVNCIIFGHKDFTENDKLVFLYTEEFGKIKVIAKGARKITSRFTGHLETLNFASAEIYFGPRNIILKEIITIKNFKKIRENFERLSAALKIAEISNQILYENQKIDQLILLMTQALQQLSVSDKPLLTAQSYIIKIMDQAGMIPDFKNLKSTLEQKYLKFFHYLKTQSFTNIEKISLEKNEIITINKAMEKLIETAV